MGVIMCGCIPSGVKSFGHTVIHATNSAIIISFADKCRTRLLDGIIDEGTPITQLLYHVDLTLVEEHSELPRPKGRGFLLH